MCDISSTATSSDTPSGRGPGVVGANLICMASMVAWAAGLPAAEYLIPILPSEQVGAIRIALAAAVLLPVWLMVDGAAALLAARWPAGLAVGSLIGIAAWFLIIGQSHGGPVTAAVITATMPVIAIALEVLLDGRRLSPALILGLALSIAGGVLALDFSGAGSRVGLGALFCFASVLVYTLGSRLTVTAFPELSLTGRTALTLTGAALTMVLIAGGRMLTGGPLPDLALWGWPQVTALAVYAIGGLAICQLLWIVSIDRLGIGMSSLHTNASPFYVMLIMYLGFGAGWNWIQAGAAVLVGIGVLVAQGLLPLPRLR